MTGSLDLAPRPAAADTAAFTTHLPIPGLGILPVNAFLIRAKEPVLVDTGVVAMRDAFFDAVAAAIDPRDIRWIWLTHTDADHVGCLDRVLEAAPNARLVTTFLGMGKLGLQRAVAPERVYLLNPGQTLDVGDRRLLAVSPPSFDAPETTGLFDTKTRNLFSADCFGALLAKEAESAAQISADELAEGLATWTTVDAPWLRSLDTRAFEASLEALRVLGASTVLSSHLPPAPGMFDDLAQHLARARSAKPFVGPDQRAMIEMMTAA